MTTKNYINISEHDIISLFVFFNNFLSSYFFFISAVTEWMPRWEKNGWKTSKNTDVLNKDKMIRLNAVCQKIEVKWVETSNILTLSSILCHQVIFFEKNNS